MIRHLFFYCAEATFITLLVLIGVFLGMNALRRTGTILRLQWIPVIVVLWFAILCVDAAMSGALGPEFTLHYYFGIWTAVSGLVLWLTAVAWQLTASLKARLHSSKPGKVQ